MRFDDLFDANGIFLQTERYILSRISLNEKPLYEALAREASPDCLPAANHSIAWDELLSKDHLTCSILQKGTGAFCGFCQLQWVFSENAERW